MKRVHSPVDRLLLAVLCSAAGKGATAVRIRRDADTTLVELLIDGKRQVELTSSAMMHLPLITALATAARLPTLAAGEEAVGELHLGLGERRLAFDVRVEGVGRDARAELRPRATD